MAEDRIPYLDATGRLDQVFHFSDDFTTYVTADDWTLVALAAGTAAVGDAANGVIVITTAATDNDDTAIVQTAETLLIADGKPISFYCRASITEAATNVANGFVGLINAAAADDMVNAGAGMRVDFSGATFFKVDGSLNWNVIYSDGTTQTAVELTAANSLTKEAVAHVSAVMQDFKIDIIPKTSTKVDINFYVGAVDGNLDLVYRMIDKTYASATEMQAEFYLKAGSAAAEIMSVDYVAIDKLR